MLQCATSGVNQKNPQVVLFAPANGDYSRDRDGALVACIAFLIVVSTLACLSIGAEFSRASERTALPELQHGN
jgi:hypothetical protein